MVKNPSKLAIGEQTQPSKHIAQIMLLVICVFAVAIFYLTSSPFWLDNWIPVSITFGGVVLLTIFSFFQSYWLKYRWIAISAVAILLVLLDLAWAKSALGVNALEKIRSTEYSVQGSSATLHIEYPTEILYDSEHTPTLALWSSSAVFWPGRNITLSAKNLLFATQLPGDAPLKWKENLDVEIPPRGSTLTVLILPYPSDFENTEETSIIVSGNNTVLESNSPAKVELEGKENARNRLWLVSLMDTGGIIVSLIIAIFAAVKQLEEAEDKRKEDKEKNREEEENKIKDEENKRRDEEKKQRSDEIKQAIAAFDAAVKSNLPKALEKYLELTRDWDDWGKALQDQFGDELSSFAGEALWDIVYDRNITELGDDISHCLQLCTAISNKPPPLQLLSDALLHQDPEALLTMLRDFPESINVAKKIAESLPAQLKKKIIDECKIKFPRQILDLWYELGFEDTESIPLYDQFKSCAQTAPPQDNLAGVLQTYQMSYSPFADAENPFYLASDNNHLIDLETPGFSFPIPGPRPVTFEFANPWDTGAGLFNYCKAWQGDVKTKEEAFFVALTPSLVERYGAEVPERIALHALAEQWLWFLAETPTIYYSLKGTRRILLGRLLRWHDFSPFIIADKMANILEPEKKDKNTERLLRRITDWLSGMDATDLRTEEINILIELRPSRKLYTLFIVPTIDLNPNVDTRIEPALHDLLDHATAWFSTHRCAFVHFRVSETNPQRVPLQQLEKQCQARMRRCSSEHLQALEELFDSSSEEKGADQILASMADGSPGKMVRLGRELLVQHVKNHPDEDSLRMDELRALE